jgi:hypothetical protein
MVITLPDTPNELIKAIAAMSASELQEQYGIWEQHAAEYEVFEEQAKLIWAKEVLRVLDQRIAELSGEHDAQPVRVRHFSITTKGGSETFASSLTDDEARKICQNHVSEFARKLGFTRKPTDAQWAWIHKLANEKPSQSEWEGTVGGKWQGNARVVAMLPRDGARGPQTIVRLLVGHNEFTWFATGTPEMAVGDVVRIDATVKAHETFRGIKQTILTRVKKI